MDEQGPSSLYTSQFAHTPDGLPPFPDEPAPPLFEDREKEREAVQRELEGEGLYALLNLPKNASPAQIRDRYRTLAITFHPDKQASTSRLGQLTDRSRAAERQFSQIQRAYEVLSDPQKRTVYDLLGEEGLRQVGEEEGDRKGWGVIRRLGTPEEIRKHYQRVQYEKRMSQIEAMVKTKGDITVNLDARACFLPVTFFKDPSVVQHDLWSRAKRARVAGMGLKHTFETPYSPSTSFLWQAQMMSRNGAGGGNVVATVRHAFGPRLWVEAGTSLIHPRVGTGKLTYAHNETTFGTLNVVQQTLKAPPTLALTVGKKVFAKTTGFATLRSGFYSIGPWGSGLAESLGRTDKPALSLGLTSQGHSGTGWTVETSAGQDKNVSLDYTAKLLDYRVKVGAALGTSGGINGFLNAERQVTENLRLGLGLTAVFPQGGITMRFRVWRLGQKIVVPLMLSPDLNPKVLLWSTVIPATSVVAFHYFFVEPRRRHKLENKMTELQREHGEYLAQKKAEALDSIALMEEHARRKVDQERESENGLIVISAHYGLTTALSGSGVRDLPGEEGKVIDVTIPVQALVNAGKLQISGGRGKFNLLGFYDPCMGEQKSLRIQYLFKGVLHEATVEDQAALRAPMRSHAVEDARNGNWEA